MEKKKSRRPSAHKRKDNNSRKRSRFELRFEIIFEDDDLIAVNKPPGLLSVPFEGSKSPNALTLVNRYLESKNEIASVVHRIDRYTSGVLIFAKNVDARAGLIDQFRAHTPHREYVALVRGSLKPASGELTHYLRLSKNGFRQQVVKKREPDSTAARLRYKTLAEGNGDSMVAIQLDTGLKNQIRVQFAAIDHPIVGDRHYEKSEADEVQIDHQALHAGYLKIEHPRVRKMLALTADLAPSLKLLLDDRNIPDALGFPYFDSW